MRARASEASAGESSGTVAYMRTAWAGLERSWTMPDAKYLSVNIENVKKLRIKSCGKKREFLHLF